jgi:hypothetical protein
MLLESNYVHCLSCDKDYMLDYQPPCLAYEVVHLTSDGGDKPARAVLNKWVETLKIFNCPYCDKIYVLTGNL